MQSIVTKYHPPINHRGAKISATTSAGKRKYFTYHQEHSRELNHQLAAKTMFSFMSWVKSTDVIYGIEQPQEPQDTYVWQVSYHCSIFTMEDADLPISFQDLEIGSTLQDGDEYLSVLTNKWMPILPEAIGAKNSTGRYKFRRPTTRKLGVK